MSQLSHSQPTDPPADPVSGTPTTQPAGQPGEQPTRRRRAPRPRSRRNLYLFGALLLIGLLLTTLFALRATRSFRHFQDTRDRPPHEAVGDIAPWMSVPYVAAAYGVPPEYIFAQLQIPAAGNDRKPLRMLERTYRNGDRVLLDEARAAVNLYYAGGVVPTPIVPDPAVVPMPDLPNPDDLPGDGPPGDKGPPDGPADGPPERPLPPADGGQP